MQNLTSPANIRRLMQRHGVQFSKKLGQNFIVNPGICPRIAEQGGAGPGVGALEIGPGVGVLTKELADRSERVVAIELDGRLLPLLDESLAEYDNVKIIHGDVLRTDLHALIAAEFVGLDVVVCANLPYYITSPIVMKLLEERLPVRSITVMVQREAAQRICASMPSRQAGAITAAIHYYAVPQILFEVSPGSFLPPPDVQSAVIRLDLRKVPPVAVRDEAMLFRVIKAAYAQRRKTLLNCMCAAFPVPKAQMNALLEVAGIAENARAEQLQLADFARIADALQPASAGPAEPLAPQ